MAQDQQIWRKPYIWVIAGVILGLLAFWLWNMGRPAVSVAPLAQAPQAAPAQAAPGGVQGDDLALIQRARNDALEEEVRRFEQALREDPCKVLQMLRGSDPNNTPLSPGVLPENAPAPPGQTPPSVPEGADPAQPMPTDLLPENLLSDNLPAMEKPATPANVGELMEQTTVFILAVDKGGQGKMGSGFFVAPGIVMSNRHVVGSASAQTLVGNPTMGGMRPGRVLAISSEENRDYALIKIPGAEAMPFLSIGSGAKRTQKVSAWGFPAFITVSDPKLEALARGDASAAPEVVYSEGVVSVVLDNKPPLIVHTAAVSQGNSGGPLIDEKGVVVGINTMIRVATESYNQSSVALPGSDMAAFIEEKGVAVNRAAE